MGVLIVMVLGLLQLAPGKSDAQAAAAAGVATVTFSFERPGLEVPRFRITVGEDGAGRYMGEVAAVPAAEGGAVGAGTQVEREVTVSAATTGKIFKGARGERLFNEVCASKAKNIADSGTKTLRYEGPDGVGSCSYNYSEDKGVVALSDLFLGMATTIDEGRKLEFKRRFDRLGLDAELDTLTQLNDSGRAIELGILAPVLRSLAGNTDLMERVRLRAAKLLERAGEGR